MTVHPELYLAHDCLAGPSYRARFDAAAGAGFTGISLSWQEIKAVRNNEGGLAPFRRALIDAGLKSPFIEFVPLPPAQQDGFADEICDMAQTAAALGCESIVAVALGPAEFADVVATLGTVAGIAASVKLTCTFEFLPYVGAVPSLADALRLLKTVDMPNIALMMDSLHFIRSGAPWSDLEALSRQNIVAIQVNDGPSERPTDNYGLECMTMRRLPGEGDFDLARFVRTLDAVAPAAPLMAEVVNSDLLKLPPVEAAELIADATRRLMGYRTAR
jgi:sugar phosphate isomerase/epimerase